MNFARILPFLLLCSTFSISEAQIQPTDSETWRSMTPSFVARAKILRSSKGELSLDCGQFVPYSRNQVNPARQLSVAFDQLEFTLDNQGNSTIGQNPLYGQSCVPPLTDPAQRYNFGSGTTMGLVYNDIKPVPASRGKVSTRAIVAWLFRPNLRFDNMAIFVGTTKNWVTDPSGVNDSSSGGRADYPGVILTFGPFQSDTQPIIVDVDLSGLGPGWTIPNSTRGGVLCCPGDFNTQSSNLAIDKGQMLLWGLKPGNPASVEDPNCWLDAFPTDGTFGSGEYFSMDFSSSSICPNTPVLGPTVAFFYDQTGVANLSPIATTVVLGTIAAGNNASLAADDSNPLKLCKGFVPSLSSPKLRFDCDFVSPYTTPSAVSLSLKARMTSAGVFRIRGFLADRSSGGFDFGIVNQVIADSAIATQVQTFTGNASNPIKYVASDGTMRSRVELQQTGFSAVTVPCTEFEVLTISLAP